MQRVPVDVPQRGAAQERDRALAVIQEELMQNAEFVRVKCIRCGDERMVARILVPIAWPRCHCTERPLEMVILDREETLTDKGVPE